MRDKKNNFTTKICYNYSYMQKQSRIHIVNVSQEAYKSNITT